MIQPRTIVKIADNSGGKVGRIFKVIGGSKKRYAALGDIVVLSVQIAEPRKGVKKGRRANTASGISASANTPTPNAAASAAAPETSAASNREDTSYE